jgi:hypothetical protein
MKVDFHVHTNVSDGFFAPEGVLLLAQRASIKILAITDHDAIEGFDRVEARLRESAPAAAGTIAAARGAAATSPAAPSPAPPLRLVAGVEFSTSLDGREVHILGYFPRGVPDELRAFLARAERARMERIETGVRNLNALGVRLTMEDVAKHSPGRSMGRAHLARALVTTGTAFTFTDAFDRFLSTERGLVPPSVNGAEEVTRLIRDMDGISIVAHPHVPEIDDVVRALAPHGLDGLEVYGKKRKGVDLLYLETLAAERGLLRTAGSDWHGKAKVADLEGVSIGLDKIGPFLERLK